MSASLTISLLQALEARQALDRGRPDVASRFRRVRSSRRTQARACCYGRATKRESSARSQACARPRAGACSSSWTSRTSAGAPSAGINSASRGRAGAVSHACLCSYHPGRRPADCQLPAQTNSPCVRRRAHLSLLVRRQCGCPHRRGRERGLRHPRVQGREGQLPQSQLQVRPVVLASCLHG